METLSQVVLTFALNAVWQFTLVVAVAAAGAQLLRRAPARYLHVVWVMALALGALLPLSSLPACWNSTAEPARLAVVVEAPRRMPVPSPTRALTAPIALDREQTGLGGFLDLLRHRSRPVTLSPLLTYTALGVYLLTLLCHLTRLARAWRKTLRLRRAARLRGLPEGMASLVAQSRTAPGLENVTILCSSQAPGPAALGFRRPIIILPEALFSASPSEELSAVLCHEMAHIRRHDYLLNLICEFIFMPVAFHPAAWLVKRRIDQTRELACDEAAADRLDSAAAYARSLVSLARSMSALTSLSRPRYTLGVFDANILEERIMRLLEKRPRLGAQRAKLLLGAAASALALVGLGACAFSFTAQENAQAQTLATEPSNPSADFSGRWELDKAKSDLPSPAPENLVQVIEQRGSELKFTTSSKDWDTNKPIAVTLFALMVPELSITADNRESVQPYGPGQMRAKSRWGDGKLITEWTLDRDGQVMMTGQWVRSLSKDGKTQTIEITAHDPNRNLDGEARAVFVKTGGGARAFLGTWRGEFQGKTFLVLTLQEEGGSLSGTIGIGGFSIDSSGQVKQVKSEPEAGEDTPIFDARWDGSLLTFKTKAGMPTTEYQFQMRVTGESAAELKGVTPPPPPGTPVGGWWKLSRQPDDSSTEIDQGGPHGGVVGGVKGGVEGGVRGYMVGVIGGIVGGVPGQGENKGTNLSGTVFDPSGARVPNTILEIDGDAGFKKISAANNVGEFSFTGLPDGRYELQAIHDGFSPFLQNVVVSQGSVRISGAPSGGQVKLGLTPGPGAVSPMINIVLDPISAMPSEGATAIAPPEVVVSQGEVVEKRRAAAPELKLERRVEPEYPPLAKAAGIEGRVVLDVTVDADGTVSDIKVVGGHPLLVKAALDAVRQWKYAASAQLPATTTVTLQFRLPEEAAGRGVVGGVPTREEKNTVDLSGTVSDPSGARVPNALVTLYGKSGSKKTAATNDAGEFSFTGLAPGDYEWKVYRDGFEVTQQKLTVSNGALKSQEGKRDVLVLAMPSPRLDIVLAPSSPMQSMVVTAKAPPEVAEKRRAAAPKRIRVGGEVEATKVLTQVPPKYPESARAKGIEGTVLLEAVISMEGVPLSLHVLESPDPELSDAALAAVRQWRYQPTLLNGQPIEVVTTIAINFHLEG